MPYKTAGTVNGPSWAGATVANLETADELCAGYSGAAKPWLRLTNFDFAVPSGYHPVRIALKGKGQSTCKETGGGGGGTDPIGRWIELALTKDGVNPVGDIQEAHLAWQTYTEFTVDPGDLWGASVSRDEANQTTFGVLIRKKSTVDGPQIWLDKIEVDMWVIADT